jgi:primosomal protein N' (replication factor Y) (superfamily II helicase)
MPETLYALVAPALPVDKNFEYLIPEQLIPKAEPGKRVLVPFRNRKITGYIIEIRSSPEFDPGSIKPIIDILDQEPLFKPGQMALFSFCRDYYQAPLGLVLKTGLPPGINVSSRKLVRITELGIDRARGVTEREAALLELIEQFEELPQEKLSALLGEPVPDSSLKTLEKKGLIEISDDVEKARIKAREDLEVRLKRSLKQDEEMALARRAREQYRLILHLKNTGPALVTELREQFNNPLLLAKNLQKRGLAVIEKKRVERKPFTLELLPAPEPDHLTTAQKNTLKEIKQAIIEDRPEVFLLRGVTGSGKTEVYIQAAKTMLGRGKTVLVLVPEIALTPQLMHRFRSRFQGEKIAMLHSGLTPAERFDQWWQIRRGEVSMVIGARSAVFAPLQNLGLIVVDEEQDSAYKQESGVHYQARDLAVWRGRHEKAPVILGSATPSLESAYNAETGKYKLLELPERVDSRPLPKIEVVDLRKELGKDDKSAPPQPARGRELTPEQQVDAAAIISPQLRSELLENFRRGNQSIIFLNRRGFAPTLICLDCGQSFKCPNCSVALTWHQKRTRQEVSPLYGSLKGDSYLLCHHCGYHDSVPDHCPNCLSARVRDFGVGTERVEKELKAVLPLARIARMDRDTMGSRRAYFDLIQQMETREIDVLVGTQMVAKGHDLAGVTLVGVLLADQSLNIPDFRSSERTFQIITQVAGRSGRGEWPGKVIIQTFNPEHYSIKHALSHDFQGFYKEEIEIRRRFGYPPFARLGLFRLSGVNPEAVSKAARALVNAARSVKGQKRFKEIRLLGPAPCPIFRLRGRVRFQVLLFSKNAALLGDFVRQITKEFEPEAPRSVRLDFDRDPGSLL